MENLRFSIKRKVLSLRGGSGGSPPDRKFDFLTQKLRLFVPLAIPPPEIQSAPFSPPGASAPGQKFDLIRCHHTPALPPPQRKSCPRYQTQAKPELAELYHPRSNRHCPSSQADVSEHPATHPPHVPGLHPWCSELPAPLPSRSRPGHHATPPR